MEQPIISNYTIILTRGTDRLARTLNVFSTDVERAKEYCSFDGCAKQEINDKTALWLFEMGGWLSAVERAWRESFTEYALLRKDGFIVRSSDGFEPNPGRPHIVVVVGGGSVQSIVQVSGIDILVDVDILDEDDASKEADVSELAKFNRLREKIEKPTAIKLF